MRAEAKMPDHTPRAGTLPQMERALADVERAMLAALDGLPGALPDVAREQLAGGGRRRRGHALGVFFGAAPREWTGTAFFRAASREDSVANPGAGEWGSGQSLSTRAG